MEDVKKQFKIAPLNDTKFIKVNELQAVTNPVFFTKYNSPTPDGLLSNEIFGITRDERASTFAYINLGTEVFLHPLHYKIWKKIDSKIADIVHGTKKFKLNSQGEFVEDENGSNGIKFLKANIDKVKFKSTGSSKRDTNIKFLYENKDTMFLQNVIVIPAYYRDVNTDRGYIGVGEINKLYNSLIISIRSLKESAEYGLSLSQAIRGRIQETILSIYTWFGTEPNIPSKNGIIKRSNLSKTTDYSSRLVLSAPNLKVESFDDLMVDMDHSGIPLASICANFFPYMIHYIRRLFENEFAGKTFYNYTAKDGSAKQLKLKDYQVEFSDDRIKKELDRYIHGYANRLIPIEVPVEQDPKNKIGKVYLRFKGYNIPFEEYNKMPSGMVPLLDRRLTWCDIFYMAALEVTKDKMVLLTRFPIDSFYNQFPTKIVVSSTKVTEPMVYNMYGNNIHTKYYPKIREEDIGSNTSNMFVDTLLICNAYLFSCGGDYDGDQMTVKGIYSVEANQELEKQLNSKIHCISLGGSNIMSVTNEGMQALYNLTLILPDDQNKMTEKVE